MKSYSSYPLDYLSSTPNIVSSSVSRTEAIATINELCLGLEEARALDDNQITIASDRAATVLVLLKREPCDLRAVRKAWRQFKFPVMLDGASSTYERANQVMSAFLSS